MQPAFLRGERIHLRALDERDLEPCLEWINDPELLQYLRRHRPMPRGRELEWLQNLGKNEREAIFGIALNDDGRLIGNCGLHEIALPNRAAELGIAIGDKRCHGRGFGSEAMRLLCKYGFDWLGLHRIGLEVYSNNPRAIRCYERLGFKHEGRKREARYWDGRWHDILQMGILEHEYRSAPAESRLAGCALAG